MKRNLYLQVILKWLEIINFKLNNFKYTDKNQILTFYLVSLQLPC